MCSTIRGVHEDSSFSSSSSSSCLLGSALEGRELKEGKRYKRTVRENRSVHVGEVPQMFLSRRVLDSPDSRSLSTSSSSSSSSSSWRVGRPCNGRRSVRGRSRSRCVRRSSSSQSSSSSSSQAASLGLAKERTRSIRERRARDRSSLPTDDRSAMPSRLLPLRQSPPLRPRQFRAVRGLASSRLLMDWLATRRRPLRSLPSPSLSSSPSMSHSSSLWMCSMA